jgi:hypothetical protein
VPIVVPTKTETPDLKTVSTVADSPPAVNRQPTAYTRQLVAGLTDFVQVKRPLTAEGASSWKQNLARLIREGATAVPAIEEFLAGNREVSFGAGGDQTLGYTSARAAMIDALAQIAGPEATAATLHTLQNTKEPWELALLAQDLDRLAPEQFRQQAAQSALSLLAAARGEDFKDKDVAPLFEVLQTYGGASVAPDLEQASEQWKYYSAIALAQLPGGAGVPSLIRMAQNSDSSVALRDPALRMLGQLASQYPEARDALVEEVRQNRIPAASWAALSPILAGDQTGFLYSAYEGTATSANRNDLKTTHIALGNQNFYSAPGLAGLTPVEITQRMGFVQALVSATADPTARQWLSNANDLLMRRLPQPVTSPLSGP